MSRRPRSDVWSTARFGAADDPLRLRRTVYTAVHETGHQFGLQARSVCQLLMTDGGSEVGKQLQVLAQPEDRLFGAQRALQRVEFPVADRTEQHGVGILRKLQRRVRQRMAMGLIGRTAHQG